MLVKNVGSTKSLGSDEIHVHNTDVFNNELDFNMI